MILCTSGRCCHPAFDCCSCCSRGRPQWLLIVQDFLDFYNSCSEGTIERWRIDCWSWGRPQWLLVQDFINLYNSSSEGTIKRWRIELSCQLVMGEAAVAPGCSGFHEFLDLLLFHVVPYKKKGSRPARATRTKNIMLNR